MKNYMREQIEFHEIEELSHFLNRLESLVGRGLPESDLRNAREALESLRSKVSRLIEETAPAKYRVLAVIRSASVPLTPVEVATRLGLAEVTVRKYLKELLREGLVSVDKSKRPYRYRAPKKSGG